MISAYKARCGWSGRSSISSTCHGRDDLLTNAITFTPEHGTVQMHVHRVDSTLDIRGPPRSGSDVAPGRDQRYNLPRHA